MADSLAARAAPVYRPELDALRFIAFLLVFIHHVLPREVVGYPRSFGAGRAILAAVADACGYGLSLFFILSAFLITDLLLREASRTGRVHIRAFYVRRILRIWPLYAFGLLIGVASAIAHPEPDGLLMFGLYVIMAGNWFFASHGWTSNPMTPLWSISIEEQFYLFWPAVMAFFGRSGVVCACGLLGGAALAAEWWLGAAHAAVDTTVWTNSFVQFETFAAGAALAVLLEGRSLRLARTTRLALVATGGAAWFVSVWIFAAKTDVAAASPQGLVAGLGLSVIGSVAILAATLGAVVAPKGLWVRLGRISFGLYVYHLLFIEIARGQAPRLAVFDPTVANWLLPALSLVPTILVAHLSYRHLERPFLALKQRYTFVPSDPPPIESATPSVGRAPGTPLPIA